MRNLLINLGIALGSVLILFALGEIGLRVTGLQTTKPNPPLIYQSNANPDISYELLPNIQRKAFREMVTTNSLGFRSAEPDRSKPIVAVLGDSITFGYGVKDDESLGAQLQNRLPAMSVQNSAVPGYNLTQEVATYWSKIAGLRPEVLILVFYPNDFNRDIGFLHTDGTLRPQGWTEDAEHCEPITAGILGYLPGKCWLDQHSAIYKAVKKVVGIRYGKEKKEHEQEEAEVNLQLGEADEEKIDAYVAEFSVFASSLPEDLQRILVIWPDRYLHVHSRAAVTTAAESHGFKVFDLYDTFGNEMETLSWDTVHPSPQSIKQAAEIIVQTIGEQ